MSRLENAAASYQQAAQLLEHDPERAYLLLRDVAKVAGNQDIVLRDLSLACLLTRRYDEALEHADRRASLGRRAGDVVREAGGLTQRGEAEDAMGRHAQAAQVLRSAVALLDPANPDQAVAHWAALGDMGSALAHAGQFGDAYRAQQEAYAIAVAADRAEHAAVAAADLAVISLNLALTDRAVEWSDAAGGHLRAVTAANPLVAAEIYGSRALALSAAGRHDEALRSIDDARQLVAAAPLPRQHLLVSGIEVARAAGRFDRALAFIDELLSQAGPGDVRARAMGLSLRAMVQLQQGRPGQAVADLRESLSMRLQLHDARGEAVILGNLVRAHLEAGENAEAARYADESERLWASLAEQAPNEAGSAGLAELIRPIISQARQELCLADGDIDGALAAAERGRQGTLTTRLRELRRSDPVPAQPPGADRIRRLAAQLNATIVLYAAHVGPDLIQPQRSWATELRAVQLWAITAGGQVSHAAVPAADLVALQGVADHAGYPELGRLLLHPVTDSLPTATGGRVIFLPAQFMWAIPFAALPLPDGQPLAQYCPVSYAPSIHALEYLAAATPAGPWRPASALVIGAPASPQLPNVDGTYQDAPPLPRARQGAQAIAGMYGASPLLGAECTVPAVLAGMPSADLIHVEAHAGLDEYPRFDRPPGMIALTPSGTDHGLLTSDMIESAGTPARLVVLSACSTGLGLPTSEGVRGLVRAFFSAGARGVIASMWPVIDAPAAMIMRWFHAGLRETGDPAAALRLAALKARSRWGDPSVWAAFVLYGL